MLQMILKLISTIILLVGVIMIFDARPLTKKFFGFGDQNEATNGFKILGFFVFLIGSYFIFFLHYLKY